jgi:hypothetical protein
LLLVRGTCLSWVREDACSALDEKIGGTFHVDRDELFLDRWGEQLNRALGHGARPTRSGRITLDGVELQRDGPSQRFTGSQRKSATRLRAV